MRPLPRRLALLSLAAVALGAVALRRMGAEAGDEPRGPAGGVRVVVQGDGLLRLRRADLERVARGTQFDQYASAWIGDLQIRAAKGPSLSADELAFPILGTRGLKTTLRVEPDMEVAQDASIPDPAVLVDDDATAVERFLWDDDLVFGDVAAALPEVYDRKVPHWFLARLEKGKIVDLPVALPAPGPVEEGTVTIAVDIAPTHEGLVRLRAVWGDTDLGPTIAVRTDTGARATWHVPAKSVPPPGPPLRVFDWTEELPPTPLQDVSDDRGVVWIDSVTVSAPMKPHPGLRIQDGEKVRTRLTLLQPIGEPTAARTVDALAAAKNAEMVVLATKALLGSARRLAEHRTKGGLAAVVVPITDVFDGFSRGHGDPSAIKDYLDLLRRTGPLRFVLLCGDANQMRRTARNIDLRSDAAWQAVIVVGVTRRAG